MSPMSPRLLRPRSTVHPEAQSWATSVIANGGTFSGSTLSAVSKFCRDIDAAGIRDRFYRLNLFCGDNLNAALVPLYRGQAAAGSQFGNTTDTNVNFVSGNYSASVGLIQGGSTKYLRTGLGKLYAGVRPLIHLAFVLQPNPTEDALDFRGLLGGDQASNNESMIVEIRRSDAASPNASGIQFSLPPASGGASQRSIAYAPRSTKKLILLSREAAANPGLYVYEDGTQKASANGSFTGDLTSDGELAVGAIWRNSTSSLVPGNTTNSRFSMYSFGLAMTSSQGSSYTSAMNTLLSALGRA